MSKFSESDYKNLEDKIFKKAYKLSEVKDKIVKVAFDIVKFKDDDAGTNLWQVQKADDGEYIVALYEEADKKVASQWDVKLNKLANEIKISYKGEELLKVNSSMLGIPPKEIDRVSQYLPEKLAENKKLVSSLIKSLAPMNRSYVLSKYPELSEVK